MHAKTAQQPSAMPCTCTKVRGLARRLTGLYDAALAAHGVTVTQYAALATIARAGNGIPVADLARRLHMDRTTTTRLVAPLIELGFVLRLDGRMTRGDGRARPLALSVKGRRRLRAAAPAWQAAQLEVGQLLGQRLRASLHRTTDAADRALAAAFIEPQPVL
jgi:DNA-binding MarR family transcriptional regulator